MTVSHTSAHAAGQIYLPAVNWALLAGVVVAVLHFGSSSALAGAYGIAVTLTMIITTVLAYFVVRATWGMSRPVAIGATTFFLTFDACWSRVRSQVSRRRLVPAHHGAVCSSS